MIQKSFRIVFRKNRKLTSKGNRIHAARAKKSALERLSASKTGPKKKARRITQEIDPQTRKGKILNF